MKEYSLGTSREQVFGFFPERVIKRIQLEDKQLAGLRIGEQIFVFQAFCPHRGASLLQGHLNGLDELICPLHSYRFDLKTGDVRSGDCGDLGVFPTRIESDGLKIMVP